ncbi:Uncharacterized protein TCM_046250 [Theobroma cacao]|uniref:Uncharacterized protein n=1 Tax=Theobroma cacao TaxID=3641 RepID=S1SMJ5_THECC|nr:Uncharacterized protein TCM_046250 [Theobroma cacao]
MAKLNHYNIMFLKSSNSILSQNRAFLSEKVKFRPLKQGLHIAANMGLGDAAMHHLICFAFSNLSLRPLSKHNSESPPLSIDNLFPVLLLPWPADHPNTMLSFQPTLFLSLINSTSTML